MAQDPPRAQLQPICLLFPRNDVLESTQVALTMMKLGDRTNANVPAERVGRVTTANTNAATGARRRQRVISRREITRRGNSALIYGGSHWRVVAIVQNSGSTSGGLAESNFR